MSVLFYIHTVLRICTIVRIEKIPTMDKENKRLVFSDNPRHTIIGSEKA